MRCSVRGRRAFGLSSAILQLSAATDCKQGDQQGLWLDKAVPVQASASVAVAADVAAIRVTDPSVAAAVWSAQWLVQHTPRGAAQCTALSHWRPLQHCPVDDLTNFFAAVTLVGHMPTRTVSETRCRDRGVPAMCSSPVRSPKLGLSVIFMLGLYLIVCSYTVQYRQMLSGRSRGPYGQASVKRTAANTAVP